LSAELVILQHLTTMKEKGSSEKPQPQKHAADKPVHSVYSACFRLIWRFCCSYHLTMFTFRAWFAAE